MTTSSSTRVSAFAPHDHGSCRCAALASAKARCDERGVRLTPARNFVLEVLLESHRAMTAYELLDRLREAGLGNQPPTVYRALDFLVENGLVHRIERLGAFVACTLGERAHVAAFMICRQCKAVAETSIDTPEPRLDVQAEAVGFSVERIVLEAEGLCAACRASEP